MLGVADLIGHAATAFPGALVPFAGIAALIFALICGSGIAATQGLVGMFVPAAAQHGMVLSHIGAFTSVGSEIGRTMSPVSAVAIMGAKLTGEDVVDLAKTVAFPLIVGFLASLIVAVATN